MTQQVYKYEILQKIPDSSVEIIFKRQIVHIVFTTSLN